MKKLGEIIGTPINCLVCGENVEIEIVGPKYAICDKCKAAILEMRKQMNDPVPKTCIIRMIDKVGSISYISQAPKTIHPKYFRKGLVFTYRQAEAHLFTRTRADKICKGFYEEQQNGRFNQFVKAEILKDNKVIGFREYGKTEIPKDDKIIGFNGTGCRNPNCDRPLTDLRGCEGCDKFQKENEDVSGNEL